MPSFEEKFLLAYKTNIKKVLLSDMVEDYMQEFERQYSFHFERYQFQSYDKTAPSFIKNDVFSYIRGSIVQAVGAMDTNGEMRLTAIDLDVFSLPGRADTDSLKLFYFYLYGTPGAYVSISMSVYKKIFPSRAQHSEKLGRFGTMFMMRYSAYEKLYDAGRGASNGWPTPSSIRHPFSGAPPVRIFEFVWGKIGEGFDKYLKKAMDLTTKS